MAEQNTSEEIDLGYMFKSIGVFFKKLVRLLFLIITFFKKFLLLIIGLIILGVIIGYFIDKNSVKVYENRIIVIPNFESVEYLYDKTDELNFKIKTGDSLYLKTIFGDEYKAVKKIEIEPINDIYNFTTKSRDNIDVFRILFENQDMKEFLTDMTTSKQYKYQKLKVFILSKDSEELLEKLMFFYNENDHFKQYQEVYVENTSRRLAQIEVMMSQADSVIKSIASASKSGATNPPVYASFNNDFFNIFSYKRTMLVDQLMLQKRTKEEVAIIKTVSINYNILEGGIASVKNVIKIPILLLFLFSLIFFVRFIYKNLKEIAISDD